MFDLASRSPNTRPRSKPDFIVVFTPSNSLDINKDPEIPSIGGIARFGSIIPPIPFLETMFNKGVG